MSQLQQVFVYGTLRPPNGVSNPHDSRYYGKVKEFIRAECAAQLDQAVIHNLGTYPAARPGKGRIIGELLSVEPRAVEIMDQIEGHPRFFRRKKVYVKTESGQQEAWIYWAPKYLIGVAPVIECGDWLQRGEAAEIPQADGSQADPILQGVISYLAGLPLIWFTTIRPDQRPYSRPIRFVWWRGRIYLPLEAGGVHAGNLADNPAASLANPEPEHPLVVDGWGTRAETMRGYIVPLLQEKYGGEAGRQDELIVEITPLRLWAEGPAGSGSWRRGQLANIG